MARLHERRRTMSVLAAPALLAAAIGLAAMTPARAQVPASEAEAKARFAVTMARFVQWPASPAPQPARSLRLCLVHRSPALASAFSAREGTLVSGRPLEIVTGVPLDPGGCDLLFMDASAGRAATEALPGFLGRPVLTLGTIDGFASQGGMVELVNVDDTLRFDVNLRSVRAAHLALSSQALKLARRIQD